ncbi:hypothetical protein PN498_26180 [Oscillatoria sp. CS-180]|uniref:hypothetical protein n=1 Tax=Oscillatoria sp. CS-180 TaxID=3021720 RepID=UPI00232BFF40|nr:hypothetical protein [Oscillatoria sp. CS-180]MDB9529506.1 hypothetical protein [Oscillatoria sp. CS-180]
MALSNWLRSLTNRLSYLTKPVPLASSLGLLLLGVFVWEYVRHPEWFGTYSQDESVPNSDIDLSDLTPEEQAAIADIDNLSVLMNELGVESGGVPNIQALVDNSEGEQDAFVQDVLALATPTEGRSSGLNDSPFARYLEQYQFAGRSFNSNNSQSFASDISETNISAFNEGLGQETSRSFTNPLLFALQNPAPVADRAVPTEGAQVESEARSPEEFSLDTPEPFNTTDSAQLPPGEFSSQTVTIPGVGFPVLPTLPQMSPPPGTTGYTPPASLNLMPPLPNRNGAEALPSPFTPNSATPNLTPGGIPDFNSSDIDVSNGYVSPYAPITPATTLPNTTINPSPFSVPRPPGSYIGGGYINTFSNPSGPTN